MTGAVVTVATGAEEADLVKVWRVVGEAALEVTRAEEAAEVTTATWVATPADEPATAEETGAEDPDPPMVKSTQDS